MSNDPGVGRTTSAWPRGKVSPPRPSRAALVARQRLLDQIDKALHNGQVVLVMAVTGAGKSSLIASWTQQADHSVAWYSCDPADRDLRRFTAGLCAAVERVASGVGRVARVALDEGAPNVDVLGAMVRELGDTRLTLVIDDVQHLDGARDSWELWSYMQRYWVKPLELILLSQTMPRLDHTRIVADDDIAGLGGGELAFTLDEARDLLTAHSLDADLAPQIARQAGGLAQLMLLVARSGGGNLRFLHRRSADMAREYYRKVADAMPADLCAFIQESAAIGPASPVEADTILGRNDSAELYADVELACGFFLGYDLDADTYRYHDDFARYLVHTLGAADHDRLLSIRRSAAAYWATHADPLRALDLLERGDDWQALADFVERYGRQFYEDGPQTVFADVVERLPDSYRSSRVLGTAAWSCIARGEYETACRYIDEAESRAASAHDRASALYTRSFERALRDHAVAALDAADAAISLLDSGSDPHLRGASYESRAIALYKLGQLLEADRAMGVALDAYEVARTPRTLARAVNNAVTFMVERGAAREAACALARCAQLHAENNSDARLRVSRLHFEDASAQVALLAGNYPAARESATRAVSGAEELGWPYHGQCVFLSTLAEVCADMGDAVGAEAHGLRAFQRATQQDQAPVARNGQHSRITAAILNRDEESVEKLIGEARGMGGSDHERTLLDLLAATWDIRCGEYQRAAGNLKGISSRLIELGRPHQAARALLLRAASLSAATSGKTTCAIEINRVAELVLPLGCEGYLYPTARLIPDLFAGRDRLTTRLTKDAAALLDRLAASLPVPAPRVAATGEEEGDLILSPFGQGRIIVRGREMQTSALPAKAREALFLAGQWSCQGEPVLRERLIDALFPDGEEHRNAFNQIGTALRKLIGSEIWSHQGSVYRLGVGVWHTGVAFERRCAIALGAGPTMERLTAAETAVSLYGDGYLDWCESPWVDPIRARMPRLIGEVTLALCGLYRELDRHRDIVALCRVALQRSHDDEDVLCALLEALVVLERVAEARRAYATFQLGLGAEFGMVPSGRLQRIAQALDLQ